jgi:transposase-like protein
MWRGGRSRIYEQAVVKGEDEQLWPQVKSEASGVYTAANVETVRLLRDGFVERWRKRFPTAVACFEEDFEACVAHLVFPVTHRKAIRTTNLLERLFEEDRRRTKVLPHAFGERPMLKLMFAAVIRASAKWRKLKVSNFEREQLRRLREEMNERFKRRHAPAVPPAPSAFSSKVGT